MGVGSAHALTTQTKDINVGLPREESEAAGGRAYGSEYKRANDFFYDFEKMVLTRFRRFSYKLYSTSKSV